MIRPTTITKYVGKRYGRIVILSFSKRDPKNKHHYFFLGRCDCGTEKNFRISGLQSGTSTSCGCYAIERTKTVHAGNKYRRLRYGEASSKRLFERYQNDAAERNLEFSLSFNDFLTITKRNCFYCGDAPASIKKESHGFGEYLYNGLDRADNDLGYVPSNCVPACKRCNSLKNGITRGMIFKLHEFLSKK